jgi:hypothetical protein
MPWNQQGMDSLTKISHATTEGGKKEAADLNQSSTIKDNRRTGFIALYRSFQNHSFWTERRVWSRAEAWLDFILQARFADSSVCIEGNIIKVPRGSFITSYRVLTDKFKWGMSKLKKFIQLLVCEKNISVKTERHYTHIFITNYEAYQSIEWEGGTQTEREQNADGTETERERNENNQETKKNQETRKPKKGFVREEVIFPKELDDPACIAALDIWLDYKKTRGESYKSARYVNTLLEDAAAWGPIGFVQSVRHSTKNNYAGLFAPRPETPPNGAGPPVRKSRQQESWDYLQKMKQGLT